MFGSAAITLGIGPHSSYSRPRIASAIAEDCYILVVLFIIFSVHRIFDVPGPIFAQLCHTTRYVLKWFISYRGVRMCP